MFSSNNQSWFPKPESYINLPIEGGPGMPLPPGGGGGPGGPGGPGIPGGGGGGGGGGPPAATGGGGGGGGPGAGGGGGGPAAAGAATPVLFNVSNRSLNSATSEEVFFKVPSLSSIDLSKVPKASSLALTFPCRIQ